MKTRFVLALLIALSWLGSDPLAAAAQSSQTPTSGPAAQLDRARADLLGKLGSAPATAASLRSLLPLLDQRLEEIDRFEHQALSREQAASPDVKSRLTRLRLEIASFRLAIQMGRHQAVRQALARPARQQIQGFGGITGQLVSEATMLPISGAAVIVWDSLGFSYDYAFTDGEGSYALGFLYPGVYFVTTYAGPQGFLDELYNNRPCPGGPPAGCDPLQGDAIVVDTGVFRTGVDFQLAPGGTLGGRLRDQGTSQPIPDQLVEAYNANSQRVGAAETDALGRYRITGLGTGSYFVRTVSSSHLNELYNNLPCPLSSCEIPSGTPVAVTVGRVTSGIDFTLERLGAISGRVRATGVGGLDRSRVEVADSSGEVAGYTYTGPNGDYTVGGLQNGTYRVRVLDYFGGYLDELFDNIPCEKGCDLAAGTPVVVVQNTTTSGIDFDLDRLGRITGVLTEQSTGQPIPNARIAVLSELGDFEGEGFTDPLGRFWTDGLAPGSYKVRTGLAFGPSSLYQDELYDNLPCTPECPIAQGSNIAVALNADSSGVDFALERLGFVSGRVTEAETGAAIPGVTVMIRDSSGELIAYSFADENGSYYTGGLQPGTYYMETSAAPFFRNEIYDNVPCQTGCLLASATPIAVSLGTEITGIDFALDRLGKISGRILEAGTGQPLSSVLVQAWDASAGLAVSGTTSDASGYYTISGLPAGSYRVTADAAVHGDELYDNLPCPGGQPPGCSLSSGAAVPASLNGNTTGIDFVLDPLAAVAGTARDARTGVGLSSVFITAWNQAGGSVATVYSNFDGTYQLTGLYPGTYFLTSSAYFYDPQLYQGLPCPGGPPGGCDPTSGTPVVVTHGTFIPAVDFDLHYNADAITGTVRAQGSGIPLAGVGIDLWRANGQHLSSTVTEPNGTYLFPVDGGPAAFYLSTDLGPGDSNQVWNHLTCPGGSAFFGFCDPLRGTPVIVTAGGGPVTADFTLSVLPIFSDGFESGDLSSWSSVGP